MSRTMAERRGCDARSATRSSSTRRRIRPVLRLLLVGVVAGLFSALFGLGGGVLAGMFGVGGGIVFVPVLALAFGLSQLDAEATSLLAILPTVVAGAAGQHLYGNVRWRAGFIVGLAGIAGVEAGIF